WGDDRSGLDPDVFTAVIPSSGVFPDALLAAVRPWEDLIAGKSVDLTFNAPPGALLTASTSQRGLSLTFPGAGILRVDTTTSTAPGTYVIRVSGSVGGVERSTTVRLPVHAASLQRPPTPVTPVRDPAYIGHAVADAAGNVHLVTARENETRVRRRLTYTFIAADGTPAPGVTVAHTDLRLFEETLLDPRIGVDSSGRVFVV